MLVFLKCVHGKAWQDMERSPPGPASPSCPGPAPPPPTLLMTCTKRNAYNFCSFLEPVCTGNNLVKGYQSLRHFCHCCRQLVPLFPHQRSGFVPHLVARCVAANDRASLSLNAAIGQHMLAQQFERCQFRSIFFFRHDPRSRQLATKAEAATARNLNWDKRGGR